MLCLMLAHSHCSRLLVQAAENAAARRIAEASNEHTFAFLFGWRGVVCVVVVVWQPKVAQHVHVACTAPALASYATVLQSNRASHARSSASWYLPQLGLTCSCSCRCMHALAMLHAQRLCSSSCCLTYRASQCYRKWSACRHQEAAGKGKQLHASCKPWDAPSTSKCNITQSSALALWKRSPCIQHAWPDR